MKTFMTIILCVASIFVLRFIYTNFNVPIYITIAGIIVGIKQLISVAKRGNGTFS